MMTYLQYISTNHDLTQQDYKYFIDLGVMFSIYQQTQFNITYLQWLIGILSHKRLN